jgi:hypothetical protein
VGPSTRSFPSGFLTNKNNRLYADVMSLKRENVTELITFSANPDETKIFSMQDSRCVVITHESISHILPCCKPTYSKRCYLRSTHHSIHRKLYVLQTLVRIYLNAPILQLRKYSNKEHTRRNTIWRFYLKEDSYYVIPIIFSKFVFNILDIYNKF